jgi:hypothetical protein
MRLMGRESDSRLGSYEVEDRQARRGSRASSVESEETDDATAVYDSTDSSLLEPFQNLRLGQVMLRTIQGWRVALRSVWVRRRRFRPALVHQLSSRALSRWAISQ